MNVPNDGIHFDVPERIYRAWPVLCQSVLKRGRESMAHLHHAETHPTEPTDAMILGSAIHVAFLEPELAMEKLAVWTDGRRQGKAWESFKAENADKSILTENAYNDLKGMARALRANPHVKAAMRDVIGTEVSALGLVHGVRMKGRADVLTSGAIWDVKSCRAADDRTLARVIDELGYAVQAHCYEELFDRTEFNIAFVESDEPYDVRIVRLHEPWLDVAESEVMGLLQRYERCKAEGRWPGRSEIIDIIEPPAWVDERIGSTALLGGESL